jgi:predicted alpha/beta-hydrolase family hydrolase
MSSPQRFLILTHGAGSNSSSPLILAVAKAFEEAEYAVLRYDLPFRQARPHGPPSPATAAQDRAGLEQIVGEVRGRAEGRPVILGGHSYGGRQSSMLAAEKPGLVDALLLLSYPLHPPRKPDQLRTAHLPELRTPALFVHGTRDPFGSPEELRQAIGLIPARTNLAEIDRAGHELKPFTWTSRAVTALDELCKAAALE